MLDKGIQMEWSEPYTPEQNGKAERTNRTVTDCARSLLQGSGLGPAYWSYAVNAAVFLLNRTVQGNATQTPYEQVWGKVPDLSVCRVFGAQGFAKIRAKGKWAPRAVPVVS